MVSQVILSLAGIYSEFFSLECFTNSVTFQYFPIAQICKRLSLGSSKILEVSARLSGLNTPALSNLSVSETIYAQQSQTLLHVK